MEQRIVVVQDAGELVSTVRDALACKAFNVTYVEGLVNARKMFIDIRPDLILIDIPSWTKSVEELLCELGDLRSTRSSRKIILASTSKVEDKALALESGADDFLLKPISTREFLARLKAALRSYATVYPVEEPSLGVLRLRRNEMEVVVGEKTEKLSRTEFNLLAFLMDHPGQVLTRDVLLENLWVPGSEIESLRIVDVYVCRLRDKIEDNPAEPRRLITRRGHGYSLIDPQRSESRHEPQSESEVNTPDTDGSL
jgi:two-component system response regulator VicR